MVDKSQLTETRKQTHSPLDDVARRRFKPRITWGALQLCPTSVARRHLPSETRRLARMQLAIKRSFSSATMPKKRIRNPTVGLPASQPASAFHFTQAADFPRKSPTVKGSHAHTHAHTLTGEDFASLESSTVNGCSCFNSSRFRRNRRSNDGSRGGRGQHQSSRAAHNGVADRNGRQRTNRTKRRSDTATARNKRRLVSKWSVAERYRTVSFRRRYPQASLRAQAR
jgi:hypothetical protein